jgi:hypothetical protein
MADEIKMIAGSGGSKLYATGTFKTSDDTLNEGTRSIYVREDATAMITSMKVNGVSVTGSLVGANLKAGDFFTFDAEITEIVIAAGSFIGYEVVGEE